ncbi:hypothetical protein [Streptomyces sp. NPDC029526]|uniref:hypothetical protein n=1 Tax=Streptomyces sp. NPDC029526 TaxID=3155728 RepID=UPI00340EB29F
MLPPSAIAGVSLVCALGPWVFTQPTALRLLAAVAAATAIAGSVVMRRWDAQAGKRVADLTRARASDEWRYEERTAELESDLEESRELRVKLEQRLRAKRAELAGLRNEHAALLRRYAAAEADRASVLEDRRVLEIEAAVPARALPAGASGAAGTERAEHSGTAGAPETADAGASAGTVPGPRTGDDARGSEEATETRLFSPEGSRLFLRAGAALARFEKQRAAAATDADTGTDAATGTDAEKSDAEKADAETAKAGTTDAERTDAVTDGGTPGPSGAGPDDTSVGGTAEQPGDTHPGVHAGDKPGGAATAAEGATGPAQGGQGGVTPRTLRTGLKGNGFRKLGGSPRDDGPEGAARRRPEDPQEDDAEGKPVAAAEHDRATAAPAPTTGPADSPAPSGSPSARQPSGHFTVPTAVAVVPPTVPVRRPVSGDGFDFFGTKKGSEESALEDVQNEDLADVVGPEALALHKAEAEAGFKAAGDEARAVGQVIDLTEHDETEHIDVEGLRSAVS